MRIWKERLLDSSRGRVVDLLRAGPQTADDIASRLDLTPSAVRAQLTAMERDGVVRRAGHRPGVTRPSQVFELTAETQELLSSAYVPLLTQLVNALGDGLSAPRMEAVLRESGRRLADALSEGRRPAGDLASRVSAASDLLNDRLGAMTTVERNGKYVIRSVGCPLAALTGSRQEVCLAMESLLTEVVGTRVRERCVRGDRPECRFEVRQGPTPAASRPSRKD